MTKWKTVRVRQELITVARRTIETSRYQNLSQFVSEAIRMRLDDLKQSRERITEKQAEYPVIPERLLYTDNHMWALVTPEGNIRIGLSDYAQERLKGVVGIQTDLIGCEVNSGEPFGVVETWMFMFDLHSPVSGKIVKFNKVLQEEPSIINNGPHEMAWIAEIKPSNLITLEEELRSLMKPHQYKMWVSKLSQPRILGI